jgi:hypothetical protein
MRIVSNFHDKIRKKNFAADSELKPECALIFSYLLYSRMTENRTYVKMTITKFCVVNISVLKPICHIYFTGDT